MFKHQYEWEKRGFKDKSGIDIKNEELVVYGFLVLCFAGFLAYTIIGGYVWVIM